jgi:hypothetical protein
MLKIYLWQKNITSQKNLGYELLVSKIRALQIQLGAI